MTRINCIPPDELITRHLVAEYRELPRVFALVRASIARGEVPEDTKNPREYRLGTGHVLFFYGRLGYLAKRQTALVAEMQKRGFKPTFTDPHLLIDGIKLQFQQPAWQRTWFFGDQLAHMAILVAVWSFHEKITWYYSSLITVKSLIIGIAILFVLKPASIITKNTISRWTPNSSPSQNIAVESLKDAGVWIGFLERLMILTFILMGRWEGVGFLLAAKSVFRFGDLKEPKETKLTEYVVIGTFLSFFIAIMTGLLSSYLLTLFR